jgi:hypothetical protein
MHHCTSCVEALLPVRDAAVARAGAAVVTAEAVGAVAALGDCALRHAAGTRMRGRVDDVAVVIGVVTVAVEIGFVGLLLVLIALICGCVGHPQDARRDERCNCEFDQRSALLSLLLSSLAETRSLMKKAECLYQTPRFIKQAALTVLDAQTLNKKFITSPSCTMYSFPSARIFPASFAPCSPLNVT